MNVKDKMEFVSDLQDLLMLSFPSDVFMDSPKPSVQCKQQFREITFNIIYIQMNQTASPVIICQE